MRRNKKQQKAYNRLIRSNEPLAPGEKLPIHVLPEVQKRQNKEYKRRASIVKRIGESATVGYALAIPYPIFGYMSGIKNKAERVEEAKNYKRTGRGNEFAWLSVGRLIEIDERRTKSWEAARKKTEARFREEHPNIALREAELHKKWEDRERKSIFYRSLEQSGDVVKYFKEKRPQALLSTMYTRSEIGEEGFISRRQELAEATLSDELMRKKRDGAIPLLSVDAEKSRFETYAQDQSSLGEISRSEKEYVQGAASLMWQLGFLEMDMDEKGYRRAGDQCRFNPDIEWHQSAEDKTVTASLAFDQENEFHQMLASDTQDMPLNPMIQVNVSQEGMDLQLAEAPVPATMATA